MERTFVKIHLCIATSKLEKANWNTTSKLKRVIKLSGVDIPWSMSTKNVWPSWSLPHSIFPAWRSVLANLMSKITILWTSSPGPCHHSFLHSQWTSARSQVSYCSLGCIIKQQARTLHYNGWRNPKEATMV